MLLFAIAVLSYLIGSIPFGFVIARWVAGVDLRTVGSGNIGATNAGRVLGKTWGAIILGLDAAKGLLPTLLLPQLLNQDAAWATHTPVLAGVCAIIGHVYPCWLGFRGGKGVATALGVALVLAPWGTLVALLTFLLCMAATRIVSLGSILGAVTFAVFQAVWLAPNWCTINRWSLSVFSAAVPLLIVLRHRSNIVRLLKGEEGAWRPRTPTEPSPPT